MHVTISKKGAIKSQKSFGREFPEAEDKTRTPFERDRDRIIHSKSFRRLSGKTQVFVATYGDHFRDRLTHTLEVAQIARGMSRSLGLIEDLAEAISLAHDLGHTPFGHAGEEEMDKIMRGFGFHFEHNEQSKRIVEKLEKQFPNFDGLNLTFEVRQGLAKHQTVYDQSGKKILNKSMEAQVADIADEIAYINHDLDDGLRSELYSFKDLKKLELWSEATEAVFSKYGKIADPMVFRHRTISHLTSMMIENAVANAAKSNLSFSEKFKGKIIKVREFLWNNMYQSPAVLSNSKKGQEIIRKLFVKLYKNPSLMPESFYKKVDVEDPLEIIVKDYVAGCTDQYAKLCVAQNANMTTRK